VQEGEQAGKQNTAEFDPHVHADEQQQQQRTIKGMASLPNSIGTSKGKMLSGSTFSRSPLSYSTSRYDEPFL
jgi:hypothetical protein